MAVERSLVGAEPPREIDETSREPRPGLSYVEAPTLIEPIQHIETARYRIALMLVGIFGITIIGILALLFTSRWTGVAPPELRSILETLLPPIVTLVSVATGFYFGAQAAASASRRPQRSPVPPSATVRVPSTAPDEAADTAARVSASTGHAVVPRQRH